MKKISCWKDLDGIKFDEKKLGVSKGNGEIRLYKTIKKEVLMGNVEHLVDYIAVWNPEKDNLKKAVKLLKVIGFDIKYEEFNLVEFLKNNIKPKIFKNNENNYFFTTQKDDIRLSHSSDVKIIGAPYFKLTSELFIIENTFFNNNITTMQLIGALEELGWM